MHVLARLLPHPWSGPDSGQLPCTAGYPNLGSGEGQHISFLPFWQPVLETESILSSIWWQKYCLPIPFCLRHLSFYEPDLLSQLDALFFLITQGGRGRQENMLWSSPATGGKLAKGPSCRSLNPPLCWLSPCSPPAASRRWLSTAEILRQAHFWGIQTPLTGVFDSGTMHGFAKSVLVWSCTPRPFLPNFPSFPPSLLLCQGLELHHDLKAPPDSSCFCVSASWRIQIHSGALPLYSSSPALGSLKALLRDTLPLGCVYCYNLNYQLDWVAMLLREFAFFFSEENVKYLGTFEE